ncbi:TetR/AcrR family transcriptional regulator [Actinokineospora enzanensis]|uniref:TetR/AcrR family transcriptional regulator n=1 Tax=Actinokineospora enzanensis TaxID=155975 RepID=UPI00037F2713|nr:TetR/AcrR family transcriptional regulator [Actinokineospora enzanensis]
MIQRSDTWRSLLDAATDHIARNGPDAPLRAICDQAGVRLPTLYHFFGDKQGLLDAVLDACLERYLDHKRGLEPTGDVRTDLRRGWDLHIGFVRAHPRIHPLLFPPGSAAARRSLEPLRAGFEHLARTGTLRPGLTAEVATRSLSSALRGVATTISLDPDRRDNLKLSTTVRDAVIDALLNRRRTT